MRGSILAVMAALTLGAGGIAIPAMAQQKPAEKTQDETVRKRDLVEQMHKIRPAKDQVQDAVEQISKSLPPAERDKFLKMVESAFDYDALEKKSRDAMTSIFTVAELEKMVDYFSSPEAKSIGKKLPQYNDALRPDIMRMLDSAMMKGRTGATAQPKQ